MSEDFQKTVAAVLEAYEKDVSRLRAENAALRARIESGSPITHVEQVIKDEALRRFVQGCHNGRPQAARWTHVKKSTGHGKGFSWALCKWAGVDPDEVVGEAPNDIEEDPDAEV